MLARRIQPRSAGFTLIELLVVIAIIGVLASLLMAGVMRVRNVGKEAACKSDLRQLDANINAFKAARKVDHLPSFGGAADGKFRLRRLYPISGGGNITIPDQQSVEFQYLIRVFPGLTNNKVLTGPNTGAIDLDPNNSVPAAAWFDMDCNQTMVFFLTGGEVTRYSGFSNDATRPFDTSPGTENNRKGKYLDIPHNRIQVNAAGQTQGRYLDPWGTPYVYMAPFDGKLYPTPQSVAGDVIPQSVLVSMGV